jgi:hypothetical protein
MVTTGKVRILPACYVRAEVIASITKTNKISRAKVTRPDERFCAIKRMSIRRVVLIREEITIKLPENRSGLILPELCDRKIVTNKMIARILNKYVERFYEL